MYGETFLHRLANIYSRHSSRIRAQIAKFLIEQGADATIQEEDGKYPYQMIRQQWDESETETQQLYKALVAPMKKNVYGTLRLGTGNVFPWKFYPALARPVQGNVIWPAEEAEASPNETNEVPNIPSFSLFEYNTAQKVNRNRTNKNRNKGKKSRKVPKKTPYQQLHANQPNKPTGYFPKNLAREVANFTY